MVAPARELLAAIAEIDETEDRSRDKYDTIRGGGGPRRRAKCSEQARTKSTTARSAAFATHKQGVKRRIDARFRRSQQGKRRKKKKRRKGRKRRREKRGKRKKRGRKQGRASRAAVEPSRLLQREELGARRPPRLLKKHLLSYFDVFDFEFDLLHTLSWASKRVTWPKGMVEWSMLLDVPQSTFNRQDYVKAFVCLFVFVNILA